jgi:predicted nucleic acid-binding protein
VIAYVDTSVLLRVALGEGGVLREWKALTRGFSSELIRVECRRTIDRARIRLRLSDDEVADQRAAADEWVDGLDIVRLDPPILERASQPFPTLLRTLDALHLASALALRPRFPDLAFATHDGELGIAAKAVGFRVLGAPTRPARPSR